MANWLSKYEQGGMVLKQKTKDNYGKQSNYNDAKASVGPDFVGLGYNTKGRDYSPAWGGQFQNGGKAYKSKPMAQSSDIKSASNTFNADDFSNYSTIINKYPNMSNDTSYMYTHNTPTGTEQFFHNTNQGKPVSQLQRGNEFINLSPEQVNAYKQKILQGTGGFQDGGILGKTFLQPNSSKLPAAPTPGGKKGQMSTELAMSIGGEGGQPGYLIPTFKYGKPLADPEAEFRQTGEHLGGPFKTWQAAEKWGKERHKFVEKGQSVPSPTKTWDEFAMGGGLPGATGMMYARTVNPAPSNGKYTKKTKASAQNGSVIKDDMGQWAHPGEITEIGSNDITMYGVDYPVLGVSDTGHTQMMQPNQDYKFDGKKVTEYPMMQKGGWLNKYK